MGPEDGKQQAKNESTLVSNQKELASEGKEMTTAEDVAAASIQTHLKKQRKKADRGQEHGKKEPTFASDIEELASVENLAGVEEDVAAAFASVECLATVEQDVAVACCRLVTVEEDVAAAQIQSQIKNESKKADRGQQHGKKEPTVALDTNDSASVEYLPGVEEDVAVASCRLVTWRRMLPQPRSNHR